MLPKKKKNVIELGSYVAKEEEERRSVVILLVFFYFSVDVFLVFC